jgi:hypothetical protein
MRWGRPGPAFGACGGLAVSTQIVPVDVRAGGEGHYGCDLLTLLWIAGITLSYAVFADREARRDLGHAVRYRFTVKLMALLMPAVVFTVTFTAPYLAFVGTLHTIRVVLQETYLVHALLPNFTEPVRCAAPRFAPLIVTRAPRLPEAGLSLVMLGAAGTGGKPPVVVARMMPSPPTAQP